MLRIIENITKPDKLWNREIRTRSGLEPIRNKIGEGNLVQQMKDWMPEKKELELRLEVIWNEVRFTGNDISSFFFETIYKLKKRIQRSNVPDNAIFFWTLYRKFQREGNNS